MDIILDTKYTLNGNTQYCKSKDDLIDKINEKYEEAESNKAKEIKVYVVYY